MKTNKLDKIIDLSVPESESKNNILFDLNRDSITIIRISPEDQLGNFIDSNNATTAIFGYTKKELLSMNSRDIEIIDDNKRKERIETLKLKGRLDFETIIKNKDGNLRNVEVKSVHIDHLDELVVMNFTRDITEHKQNEENTRKAQESLTTILEAITDMLFEVNLQGKIYYYQSIRNDFFQKPKDHFIGKSIPDVLPLRASTTILQGIQEAHIKGWSTGKKYSLDLPKRTLWFELSISLIKEAEKINPRFIVLSRDVTIREEAEEKLKVEKKRLHTILELMGNPIFLKDNNHRITYANSAFYTLFDLNEKNVIGKTLAENVPEDEKNQFLKIDRNVLDTGTPDVREEKLTVKGVEHTIITNKTRFIDGLGNKSLVGSIFDVTEQKLAKLALEKEKRRLATILIGTRAGTWEWNIKTGKTIFNDKWAEIIGYTLEELAPISIDTWKKYTHPDDLKNSNEILSKHFQGQQDYYECEVRMKHKNGDWIWVLARGKLNEWDLDGNPLYMSGTHLDITERKQAEKDIENYLNLVQKITSRVPGVVYQYLLRPDGSSCFPYASEGIKEIYRVSPEEVREDASKVFEIIHPDDYAAVAASIQESAKYLTPWKHEYCVKFNDETVRHLYGNALPQKQIDGSVLWHGFITDITEKKITENSLRESEEKYRSLVENSPDGILIFIEDKISFINYEGLRMLGATIKKEIIHKSILQFVHPESVQNIVRIMKEVVADNTTSKIVEERFININGIPFDVEIKAIPTIFEYKNAVQVIVHDVTERKRTEDKIKQLSQAVEQSPVAIVITNTFGEIEYINPKFTETSGYSFDEILGQNSRILKSGHTSYNEYIHLWQTLIAGEEWFGEFHNKRKDGTLYWESASISPIFNSQGKATHYIAIKEDITERKNVEQQLIKAKEKAEESDRLKLSFLANMSHEIRTPMNGILGFTELLKERNLDTEIQQEYINIIEKSGIRMLNIINDIISISKIESGQVVVALSETDIKEQLEFLTTFFKPEATNKGINLIVKNLLSPKETIVKTDQEKLYAILTNLIKNALKFTNCGTIEIGCEKKGKNLEFFVKDTGLGISNSQKTIIFERFRQANDTSSRSHEGSGLGLAISKAYIETLGGKIWVESEEGKGSSFYFTLPYTAKSGEKEEIVSKKAESGTKKENKIKDLKILIVEDDAISKLLITIAVKPYSKEIIKVSTGFEAIEACRKNPDIDLVMMDINMPEMDGYEATKKIRQFNKNLIIIAQTANGMQSDHDNAIEAGCTNYISKPINISSLGALIQKYFKR